MGSLEKKSICTDEMLTEVLELLSTAPSGQMIPKLRDEVVRFKVEPSTLHQKFSFISSISKKSLTDVSSFVKELCDLEKFYEVPECNHIRPDGSDAWVSDGYDSHKTYYKCSICGKEDWW